MFFINSMQFSNEDAIPKSNPKFRLIYDNPDCSTIQTQFLVFENKGQAVLRFYWNKFEKYRTFKDLIPRNNQSSSFYFDKSVFLLIPGKELRFPIWFKPDKPGNYSETWQLTTAPFVWDDDFKINIVLQGICNPNLEEFSKRINDLLENRMKATLVKELLNEIRNNARYHDSTTKKFTFSEGHIFESKNMESCGFEKRPKYIFKPEVVRKLKELYDEVRGIDDEPVWNYSVKTLMELARRRDILNYIEKQVMLCNIARNRRLQLNMLKSTNSAIGALDMAKEANKFTGTYLNINKLL